MSARSISTQIVKEFWFPTIAAVAYTGWLHLSQPRDNNVVELVGKFGAAFFLCAWIAGQVFRIRKQVRSEIMLSRINNDVGSVYEEVNKLSIALGLKHYETRATLRRSAENVPPERNDARTLAQDARVALVVFQFCAVAQAGGLPEEEAEATYNRLMSCYANLAPDTAEMLFEDLKKILTQMPVDGL